MNIADSEQEHKKGTSESPEENTESSKEGQIKRPQLLRLKSENGANSAVSGILAVDQTPTPTRLLNKLGEIFPNPFEDEFKKVNQQKEEKDKDSLQTGSSGTPQVVSVNALPGPDIATAPVVVSQSATTQPASTLTVSSVTTPAVASTVVTTGGATSTPAEVQAGDVTMNETPIEEIPTYDHEETIGNDDTIDEEEKQNGMETPNQSQGVINAEGQNFVFATPNQSFTQSNNMPIMVMGGGQQVMVNGSQVASPMRVVSAQATGDSSGGHTISMNGQSAMISAQQGQAQPQQMLIPTSNGTQMIVNGTIANGGVQPFVMQQVMQIQDPTTGAIQTVITQPPQQPQFTMVQTVDPNNSNGSSSNGNPPSYQCVMMPQQIQFVPQQFQVVPTNQHMIVNSQGQALGQVQQQVQIINHGPVSNQNSQNGQTAMITQIQQSDHKGDSHSSSPKSRSRTNSQLSESLDQSVSKYDKGPYSSTRPSYTHRPQLADISGLSSVVQLSKEALQAIEQAGNECGVGKRGGPRLNYDDLDPKRRKFLERNRQAAARCRERKKQWIVSLEGRSNELKDDNRRVEEDVIRLKTKVDQLRKVLTQQDRNIQSTHQRTQVVGQVQQEVQMETEMNTDSGVETAESLPTGEIIMAKTEMEAES